MSAVHGNPNLRRIHDGVAQQNTSRALMHQVEMKTISAWGLTAPSWETFVKGNPHPSYEIGNMFDTWLKPPSNLCQDTYMWRLATVFNKYIAGIDETCSGDQCV